MATQEWLILKLPSLNRRRVTWVIPSQKLQRTRGVDLFFVRNGATCLSLGPVWYFIKSRGAAGKKAPNVLDGLAVIGEVKRVYLFVAGCFSLGIFLPYMQG